jgi:hypothetical protein
LLLSDVAEEGVGSATNVTKRSHLSIKSPYRSQIQHSSSLIPIEIQEGSRWLSGATPPDRKHQFDCILKGCQKRAATASRSGSYATVRSVTRIFMRLTTSTASDNVKSVCGYLAYPKHCANQPPRDSVRFPSH